MLDIINFKIVFKVISRNLFIVAFALLSCIPVAIYNSEDILPFLSVAALATILGLYLSFITRKNRPDERLHKKEAYLTVTLSWFILSIVGCLPYIISGSIPSFVNAFFESISGFTTTGASILTDIEILPKSILFWRSLTHWVGGIGIIVLVIIIMPSLHMGGYNLFTMESSVQEKILPKVKAVGNRLLIVYVGLTFAEVVLLLLGKMSLFESVCHAFGTIATGGFSPKNSSIIDYSPYIQYVIMIFMLLAGVNFILHYYMLKRNFGKVKENEEFRFYLLLIVVIGSVVTAILYFSMNMPFEKSFRDAFFQVISIITCTGFASTDYLQWPVAGWVIIFFSMFLGGSTGSTAGGIKTVRHLIIFKNFRRYLRQLVNPNAVINIRLNRKPIDDEVNRSILTFVSAYFIVFFIGTFLLIADGSDTKTASSAVATCMAGIGPGIGTVGPVSNFAHLHDFGKLTLSFLMLLGRLEIYTILILFTRNFWKK